MPLRPARVALVVGLFVLAAGVGVFFLFSNVGCASLTATVVTAERRAPTPSGEPVVLEEDRTRGEAPRLAALLDAALRAGSASLDDEGAARAAHDYLGERAHEQSRHMARVQWQGALLDVRLMVC